MSLKDHPFVKKIDGMWAISVIVQHAEEMKQTTNDPEIIAFCNSILDAGNDVDQVSIICATAMEDFVAVRRLKDFQETKKGRKKYHG